MNLPQRFVFPLRICRHCLLFALLALTACAGLFCHAARAQEVGKYELYELDTGLGQRAAPPQSMLRASGTDGRFDDARQSWRRELEKAGIIDRNSPYRVGLPLAVSNDGNTKLMFTYLPRMKHGAASRVFLLYVKFNLD